MIAAAAVEMLAVEREGIWHTVSFPFPFLVGLRAGKGKRRFGLAVHKPHVSASHGCRQIYSIKFSAVARENVCRPEFFAKPKTEFF